MKEMLFVFNPCSGREQIRGKLMGILDLFTRAGYDIHVHVTQRQGDCREWVRDRGEGMDLIVCSGGDGTLNEAISGMLCLGQAPVLGYIPSGSTNDFASSLGIPRDMIEAAGDIVGGIPFPVDVGSFCQDRYFAYIAGFGAFTEVSYLTPQDKKNWLGRNAYMIEGVKSLAGLKPRHMKVEWEGNLLEDDFVFGMVTNTVSVGGFKGLVNQSVALDDGEFEVLLIRMPRTPVDLTNIINYMFLKAQPNEYVHKFKASSIRMYSDEPVDWVLDGEFGGSRTEVRIENLKQRIRIMRGRESLGQEIGTRAGRNFALILSKLERLEPAQMAEQMEMFAESLSEAAMTAAMKKAQRAGVIITALGAASVFALLVNFTVVVIFLRTVDLLSGVFA